MIPQTQARRLRLSSRARTQQATAPVHSRPSLANIASRGLNAPASLRPAEVLDLQQAIGNAAVSRLVTQATPGPAVQAKLKVESAASRHEDEANRVAQQVVMRLNPQRSAAIGHAASQPRAGSTATPTADLQRQGDGEDPATGSAGGLLSAQMERAVRRARTGGRPLAPSVRGRMEQAFGADLGAVRIHTSPRADTLNRAMGARAFTLGADVFFGRGEFRPDTVQGQGLLAHELTHVRQQTGTVRQAPAAATLESRLPSAQQSADGGQALGQVPQITQQAQPGRIHRCGPGKKKRRGGGNTGKKGGTGKGMTKAPVLSDEEKFLSAYQSSRTYHGTYEGNVDSILEQGLLTSKVGTGAMALNPEFKIDDKVVHLGLTSELSQGYAHGKRGLLRPFLPSNRKAGKPHMWGMKNYQPSWPEDVDPGQLVFDEKHRGGEAVITGQDIPGQNIMSGTHEELLDSNKESDQTRLNSILNTIGTHYPTLHGEEAPDPETLRKIYTKMARERRLSRTDLDWFG